LKEIIRGNLWEEIKKTIEVLNITWGTNEKDRKAIRTLKKVTEP